MQFNWIFSIIIGAVIIFFAIFAAYRYINLRQYEQDTQVAAQLAILLNPLETGLAEAASSKIALPAYTRIELKCFNEGIGRQELRIETKSNIGEKWQEFSAKQDINNKYIFFRDTNTEGKTLYVFSKPFEMPFQIADLLYISLSDYCFVSPPSYIESELKELNMSNIHIASSRSKCKGKSVCFSSPGCDVGVYGLCYGCSNQYDYGNVEADGERLEYTGDALMYAAIFSPEKIYDCNIKRLSARIKILSRLLAEKARLLSLRGCETGSLRDKLLELVAIADKADLTAIKQKATEIEAINSALLCRVF